MRRRDFIALLGGAAAAWPLAALAQQPAMPVIGFLSSVSPEELANFVAAFHEGLRETGYVEGRNVAIEYRFARGHNDRLPEFAADLVRRRVDVIAAPGTPPGTVAAKGATTSIPIVFFLGGDPVASGFVASLNHPGGNLTGVTTLGADLGPKRLEPLHELVPTATLFGALINPAGSNADVFIKNAQAGARTLGLGLEVVHVSTDGDLDSVFETLVRRRAGGLVIAPDQFLYARSGQIAARAARHGLPTIFQYRESAKAGGVMSYGGNAMDAFRLVGVYTGRILNGEKPSDLPVHQSTKVELVINLKAATALGLEVPPTLLARADEVIE
jgi:putative tryptophan/tyrosine transport system substrate-binding protein